ncbi:GIY-YIG nuclease family protein [Sphingomonas rubra]|uniref:GIY-YIG catalytic domain-containing protein n=1 Tax=Sphingomonas rubra TaxID=634430 RepID=A0A1I5T9Y7_9SPHN|nr:GIY-YIG nuclease family protein [Sphingomonas rubra]SFP79855.1 GIY-YIG catalytic domain-containing protein [Sphingomonas rubra]
MLARQPKREDLQKAIKVARRDRAERLLTREISWSPDGTVELVLTREFMVPDDAGVYLIHDLRGILYVGQSRKLRQRFAQHDRLRRNRLLHLAMSRPVGIMRFSWRLVADEEERSAFERELVATLQPVCNRQLLDTPLT